MFEINPPRHPPAYAPSGPFLSVLYEDADILAVSKQSGLLSVPGRSAELADCIEARVRARYGEAMIAHRLDQATSGVMVLARNLPAQRGLSRQFELRQVEKSYIARVWGEMARDDGEVDAPLIRDWPNRPRQMIDHEQGRQAMTAWRVLSREDNSTRVELIPRTGRTHQLRVHMLSLGHPILGDHLYAHAPARAAASRLQLHAQSISLSHPVNGRHMTFEDPCPF